MVKKQIETRNINVTIDLDLHNELRIMALKDNLEFHDFIRVLLQNARRIRGK